MVALAIKPPELSSTRTILIKRLINHNPILNNERHYVSELESRVGCIFRTQIWVNPSQHIRIADLLTLYVINKF